MILGLDIGGTKIGLAAFDDALTLLWTKRTATPIDDYEAFLSSIDALVAEADREVGPGRAIGVGVPGLVDEEGRLFCANVPCVMGRQVGEDIQLRLARPATIENDCRLFALSESHGGAGDGLHSVLGTILGTGASAGLIIDGKIERGRRGGAGEYGHLPLSAALQQQYGLPIIRCNCGQDACAEAYISGPGLVTLGAKFGVSAESAPEVVALWRAGDQGATKTYEVYMNLLGTALANVVKMVDPDVIVVGGGLSNVAEIVGGLPAAIASNMFDDFGSPPVLRARFGDSSGARGAALLAREATAA